MAPLVRLLAVALVAGHGAFSQIFAEQETLFAGISEFDWEGNDVEAFAAYDEADSDDVELYSTSPSPPMQVCTDSGCDNCFPLPDIKEGKLKFPSCAAYNLTDLLKNKPGAEKIVSGAKMAYFKIPEPVDDCKFVIRKPVSSPGVAVQNCGVIQAIHTKGICAAQPLKANLFMLQKCCGEDCFDGNPKHAKRADDAAADAGPQPLERRKGGLDDPNLEQCWKGHHECEAVLPLVQQGKNCRQPADKCPPSVERVKKMGMSLCFHKEKKCVPFPKLLERKPWPVQTCEGGACKKTWCGEKRKCDKGCPTRDEDWCEQNTLCPDINVARPIRGVQADARGALGARALADLRQRLAEENNAGTKFGLGRELGDLGLASLRAARDKRLSKEDLWHRGLLWKVCMVEPTNWISYGRYKKPDERTQLLGAGAPVVVPWSTTLTPATNSLRVDTRTPDFIKAVFKAVLNQKRPTCGIFDQAVAKHPAAKAGSLGFTPILDCTIAIHSCGNWMGDPQIHEFCVPTVAGKKEALGVVSPIERH